MPRSIINLLVVSISIVGLTGCIYVGGAPTHRILPDRAYTGPTTRLSLPATQPIRDESSGSFDEFGVSKASPDLLVQIARKHIEASFGSSKYIRDELPNSRILHRILSPGYAYSNKDRDYQWLEVLINLDPAAGVSQIEAHIVTARKYEKLTSHNGEVWLNPPTQFKERMAWDEYQFIVTLLQEANDPDGYITDWKSYRDNKR